MVVIPIPIPIGANRIATVKGSIWKVVPCEKCQQPYAFLLNLESRAIELDLLFLDRAGTRERARARARENFAAQARNRVANIPCPHCGFYQEGMVRQLKESAWVNPTQIVGAIVFLLSFIPLALDIRYPWAMTAVLAAAGLAVVGYGYVLSFRYDPNAGDPAPRIAVGQKNAVWGERLAQVLKEVRPPDESTDGERVSR